VHAIGWNNAFKFNDSWTGSIDLSTEEAKRKAANTQSTAGLVGNCNDPATPAACGPVHPRHRQPDGGDHAPGQRL